MTAQARLLIASAVLLAATQPSWAQISIQPAATPIVSAENETWYRAGEPVVFGGSLYYPGGAAIHFLPNEMVPSGFYRGIPLYTRTTIEPYSIVFVPIGRGLVQPYERRRDLDMPGTQGSTAPTISPTLSPAVSATTAGSPFGAPSPAMTQAAAPPVVGSAPVIFDEPLSRVPAPVSMQEPVAPANPVATAGGEVTKEVRPLIRRDSANAIYVEFQNARWYSGGSPVSLDSEHLTQIGEVQDFPVYAQRPGDRTIYVPIAKGSDVVAPYTKRK